MTRLPGILLLALLAGCFDSQAGGPGLEPPIDVPEGMGPGRGGEDFGNSGGTGGALPDPSAPGDGLSGAGGSGGAGVLDPTTGADGGGTPADGGATHAKPDPAGLSCADLEATFATELGDAQACEAGDVCVQEFHGTGCSDSLFPLCGLAYREGADIEYLIALDAAYRAANCSAGTSIACASCALPSEVSCVAGACVAAF